MRAVLTVLAVVVLTAACADTSESDAIIRRYAHLYADCVNAAVDEALARDQTRDVVERRIEGCDVFYGSISQHNVTMEDSDHNWEVWMEVVGPAEERVKFVPFANPR